MTDEYVNFLAIVVCLRGSDPTKNWKNYTAGKLTKTLDIQVRQFTH
jgi:hypothetical protein